MSIGKVDAFGGLSFNINENKLKKAFVDYYQLGQVTELKLSTQSNGLMVLIGGGPIKGGFLLLVILLQEVPEQMC